MEANFLSKLDDVLGRYHELEVELAKPSMVSNREKSKALGREYRELQKLVAFINDFKEKQVALKSAEVVLADAKEDIELKNLAKEEISSLKNALNSLEKEIRVELVPKDQASSADAILEIRAGTGGEEAALFASELRRMYVRYAEQKKWQIVLIHEVETGVGGTKESVFEVRGQNVFERLRTESGVHRVQRVPSTESSGRLHTSAATVAVLPKADKLDVQLNDDDIKIDIFHAGGHGGQNVNKVATAVRLTHIPSGLVVVCQNERSQLQNRMQAMTVLRSRLWDLELQKQREAEDLNRRAQIKGGDRSEKIRTYNFPQSRITDHRVPFTTHRLREALDGDLDEVIDAVTAYQQAVKLGEVGV